MSYGPTCPNCGVTETVPFDEGRIFIRAYKYTDEHDRCWSQCLVCAGLTQNPFYLSHEQPSVEVDKESGWFYETLNIDSDGRIVSGLVTVTYIGRRQKEEKKPVTTD